MLIGIEHFCDDPHSSSAETMKDMKSQTPFRINQKCSCAFRGQQGTSPIETLEPAERVSDNREMGWARMEPPLVQRLWFQRGHEQRRSEPFHASPLFVP